MSKKDLTNKGNRNLGGKEMRMKTKGIIWGLVGSLVLVMSLIKMEAVFNFFLNFFWSSMEGAEVFIALPVIMIWYGFWSLIVFRFTGGAIIVAATRLWNKVKGGK